MAQTENGGSSTSVHAIVRRLLTNEQLRKVYSVDEDVLWECLRVLARIVRDNTDVDSAIAVEAQRSQRSENENATNRKS